MRFRFYKRVFKKIGVQVFVAMTTTAFFLTVLISVYLGHVSYKNMYNDLANKGKLLIEILAYQSRLGLYSNNKEMLQSPIEALFRYEEVIDVAILDQDLTVILEKHRGEQPHSWNEKAMLPFVDDIMTQFYQNPKTSFFQCPHAVTVWAPVFMGNTFLVDDPVYVQGESSPIETVPIGSVRLTLNKRQFKEKLRATILKIIGFGVAFWIMGVLVAYFFTKHISKPVQQLRDGVRKFGLSGECGELPLTTPNEVGDLAKAFQEMIHNLEKHVQRQIATNKELAHANNLAQLGIATSKVTHEIGNLLNNMEMAILTLKTENLSGNSRLLIQVLEGEADRLKAFITDFLQFAKKPSLHMQKVPMDLIIKEIMAVHEPSARKCDIHLTLDWPSTILPICGDRQMLYQAIENLVKNSLEAIGEKGTVHISGRMNGQELMMIIEDSGPGIEKEVLDRLFEPFFTTKGRKGTGLGLSIVHGIVQAHGGNIECESIPEKRTRFIMRIPVVKSVEQ